MHYYPINLNLTGKKCAVVGGGAVAERKTRTILAAGGEVFVISPALTAGLSALAMERKITWLERLYQPGDIVGFFLVICATDDAAANLEAAREAKEKNVLVDMTDNIHLSDFTVPAQVRRGNLLITVSTGGQSPAVAREIKKEIEHLYGEEYGIYLDLISRLRRELKETLPTPQARETFWREWLDREALTLVRAGKIEEAEKILKKLAGRMKECD